MLARRAALLAEHGTWEHGTFVGFSLDVVSVVEGLRDAVMLIDARGVILHANPAAARLVGSSDLEGRAAVDLVPEELREVGGKPFPRFLLDCVDDAPVRSAIMRPDGVTIEIDCDATETRDASGEPVVVICMRTGQDRYDAVAPEAQIYRQVFDHAPIGLFHFDVRGVITACNENFVGIIGSSKRLLVGLDMTTLPNQGIVAAVREAVAGRHSRWEGDYRSATAEKVTPVRVFFAPLFSPEGEVSGGVGIVEDVTDRRQAERALARAERMASLGTLAAGVAHEINNPLTYVITSIDVAEMRAEKLRAGNTAEERAWQELESSLRAAHEGTDRVRTIVRDLRTFVRSDDAAPGAVDVEHVLESALKLTWNEIRHRAKLERDYASVPTVWGNEPRLVQVFVNLLANAAQAIPEGDAEHHAIRLVTRPVDDRVRIQITDTGRGIAPADLERVFEPFWTQRPGVGTGLGLSIVHGIIESLGGDIEVQSEEGKGTTFTVTLRRGEGPQSQRPPAGDVREPVSRARILIIDDEARLAQTIRLALTPEHDVEYVTSGKAAIELLDEDASYDLILCDLMLPDTTGPDIYEAVRARRPEAIGKFAFMTGGAFTPRSRDFLRTVPNPRLEKPFHIDEIRRLLRR